MGDKKESLNPFDKWKRRAKKFICAGILILLIGIVFFVVGIGVLAKFSSFWGDDTEKLKSGVSYFGAAALIFGFVLVAVSIGMFITLCVVYRKIENNMQGATSQYHLKKYAPGEAPYPQQKGFNYGAMTHVPQGQSPEHKGDIVATEAPPPSAPHASESDVKIVVTENVKL